MSATPPLDPQEHHDVVAREHGLSRQISQRQLGMIAIDGAIGTVLFPGGALAVRTAGPGVRTFSRSSSRYS